MMHILEKARSLQSQLTAWRRDFHAHPELGFREFRTAEKITGLMTGWGYVVTPGIGRTGVIADLGSEGDGVLIAGDAVLLNCCRVPWQGSLNRSEKSGAVPDAETPEIIRQL